jgi:N-acyl-L-homoserine lactone synthetase
LQSGRHLTPDLGGQFRPTSIQPAVAVQPGAFFDAIQAATDELVVELAVSLGQVLEAQQLRYRISCQERGLEPSKDRLERDEFDPASRHVLVRSRLTGALLGTVRLVLSDTGLDGLPMRRACGLEAFGPLSAMSTGEISRFAVARQRPSVSLAAGALVRLSLIRGIVQISVQQGLTHWCALMEPVLLRLLQATAIHFKAVGPVVECHGPRQPAICVIAPMLRRMKLEQPAIWAYITGNGALWSQTPTMQRNPS